MGLFRNHFVEVRKGTKITYSESDLRKLDRNYEKEVFPNEKKRIRSSFRKVPQQAYLTQVRDYAFERILDNHMYTFQHILVIPNPYDLVKQSALLLFNSSKETKIRYRVMGDTPEADFVGETEYTKRHRVPILGLYFKRSNKVELEMLDTEGVVIKRRLLRIFVSEPAKDENEIFGEKINKNLSHFPFIMVNGLAFEPIVIDCNGAIRYSIQLRSKRIGMIPLVNGHFLYEDRTANRMREDGSFGPCRYHEMDYLGRVYRTFLIDFKVTGVAASREDSLYLYVAAEDGEEKQRVIELNLQSGQVIQDSEVPLQDMDLFQNRICRPSRKGKKNAKRSEILSADGERKLFCLSFGKDYKEGKKVCLAEKDSNTDEVLRKLYFRKAVSMVWLFEPDIKEFCKAAEPVEKVIFGSLTAPEIFEGELPAEAEEPIERMYFGGIRLCDDLFVCYILPGRIDQIYFVGKEHAYVQSYEGMLIGKSRVSFAISMSGFAVDEYSIFVESRKVVHRLKNRIRVVE